MPSGDGLTEDNDDGGFTGRESSFAEKVRPHPWPRWGEGRVAPLCSALVRPVKILGPGRGSPAQDGHCSSAA